MRSRPRKIAFLTGSRGEWGYIRPIIRKLITQPELDYALLVTNMHLLPEFGQSENEILRDGFDIAERLYMTLDGYTGETMVKSLGILLTELPGALKRIAPDILLLAGDRGEQLAGALAAIHMGIAVAHIQAGELSGNVDGIVRHAITKLAHIHFAANDDFAERVQKMGEDPWRIHVTGAPLVDEMLMSGFSTPEELHTRIGIDVRENYVLCVQHPVTEEEKNATMHTRAVLEAIAQYGAPTILVYPNADAGSADVRAAIDAHAPTNIRIFRNLPRSDYLGLVKNAHIMVGNSSSGIMEAPTFGTAVVNLGRRQAGRTQSKNVINAEYETEKIVAAMREAASDAFQQHAAQAINPYGTGTASEAIVQCLQSVVIDDRLLNKKMAY